MRIRHAYIPKVNGKIKFSQPFILTSLTREKKNSVAMSMASSDVPDDHVMPVGWPNMFTLIKITNRQSNEPVAGPDEQGEIWIKSSQVFVGYLHDRNKNKHVSTLLKI